MAQVVKLAQPGYDVKTAGDENLIYSSQWPLLKIVKSGSITLDSFPENPPNPNKISVAKHDLGYPAAYWFFVNMELTEWSNSLSGALANRADFNGPTINFPIVDDSELYYWYITQSTQVKVKFYYYIFDLDLTKAYTAPSIKVGGTGGGRSKTKFKLAKPDKSVNSKELEDFIVHSEARSPLVHAVFPGTVGADSTVNGGSGFTFYHNLGYIPMFFAYAKTGIAQPDLDYGYPGYILLRPDGTGASGFKVDKEKIQYANSNIGRQVTLVVLKDPFDISDKVNVTI